MNLIDKCTHCGKKKEDHRKHNYYGQHSEIGFCKFRSKQIYKSISTAAAEAQAVSNFEVMEECDDLLSYLEDTAHGYDGKRITAIRGKLQDAIKKSIPCEGYPNCDCSGKCYEAIKYGHPYETPTE